MVRRGTISQKGNKMAANALSLAGGTNGMIRSGKGSEAGLSIVIPVS